MREKTNKYRIRSIPLISFMGFTLLSFACDESIFMLKDLYWIAEFFLIFCMCYFGNKCFEEIK